MFDFICLTLSLADTWNRQIRTHIHTKIHTYTHIHIHTHTHKVRNVRGKKERGKNEGRDEGVREGKKTETEKDKKKKRWGKEEKREKRGGEKKGGGKERRRGVSLRGVEECGYWGGQDLILIMLDRHECFHFSITCKRTNNANNATHSLTIWS